MNTNSTSSITPISEITSVSLFSEEELDFSKEYSLINKDKKCSIKCNHCKNNWSSLNTTHKRAHLSDNVFSKLYKVKLCVNVPSKTSKAAVASLKLLQDKRNSKDSIKSQVDSNLMHITTVESVAQSEFNPKRKGTISEKFNVAAATIADRKVANYIFSSKQSTRNNGMSGQHACVTQLIDDSSELDESGNETYQSYYINEELHRMISVAPFPYNQRVNLIKE